MKRSLTHQTVAGMAWMIYGKYAAMVLVGAWIGQHWGIAGVAWGTLGALTVNFVLMAELGLDVGHVTWWEFWMAHRPAVLLTAVEFPTVFAMVTLPRLYALPPAVIVAAVAIFGLALGLLLVTLAPAVFLGPDGQWMLDTMGTFVRKLRPAPAAVIVE